MIPARKHIPLLLLSMVLLLAAVPGSGLQDSAQGRWSGTVSAVSGDDLALTGVAERFRLAGSATELLSGRAVSPRDIAPGSAVTLRLGRDGDDNGGNDDHRGHGGPGEDDDGGDDDNGGQSGPGGR